MSLMLFLIILLKVLIGTFSKNVEDDNWWRLPCANYTESKEEVVDKIYNAGDRGTLLANEIRMSLLRIQNHFKESVKPYIDSLGVTVDRKLIAMPWLDEGPAYKRLQKYYKQVSVYAMTLHEASKIKMNSSGGRHALKKRKKVYRAIKILLRLLLCEIEREIMTKGGNLKRISSDILKGKIKKRTDVTEGLLFDFGLLTKYGDFFTKYTANSRKKRLRDNKPRPRKHKKSSVN